MKEKSLVLATDLDGTFLEGPDEKRAEFYQFLTQRREQISVIFVTGRTLELVQGLYAGGLDFIPDYIIADHGTVIVGGGDLKFVDSIQTEIIARWNRARHDELKALLRGEAVQEQPFNPPYRHAYYYHSDLFDRNRIPQIEALGFECILSHDVYLDILPAGVHKGSTLRRLLTDLEVKEDNVVACGDSLNDLPLFREGYNSIAVGNSEPLLVQEIQSMQNVYYSSYPGVLGIIDGLSRINGCFSQNAFETVS